MATIKAKVASILRVFMSAVVLFNALAPTLAVSASSTSTSNKRQSLDNTKTESKIEYAFSRPSPRLSNSPQTGSTISQQVPTPTPTQPPSTNAVTLCSMPGGFTYQVVSWPGYLQIKYSGSPGGDHHIFFKIQQSATWSIDVKETIRETYGYPVNRVAQNLSVSRAGGTFTPFGAGHFILSGVGTDVTGTGEYSWSGTISSDTLNCMDMRSASDADWPASSTVIEGTLTVAMSNALIYENSVLNPSCKDSSLSNAASTQSTCGDPINPRTGTFSEMFTDLSVPTSAGELTLERSYSSSATWVLSRPLAYGWTHNHNARLIFPESPGSVPGYVVFQSPLGNQLLFKIESNGSYTPGKGILASLTKSNTTPATYTVVNREQEKFIFDANGKLTSQQNAQGQAFTYEYDGQSRLIKASADGGTRYIQIGYDAQNRIIAVIDHTGRHVAYGYNAAGDLTTFTDVFQRTWTYVYDTSHRLTQIKDPNNNQVVKTDYDSLGRATQQHDGNGNLITSVQYNANGTSTISDAFGNPRTDTYDFAGTIISQSDANGGTITKTYDGNFRPATMQDKNGNPITLTWSANGANLTHVDDALHNQTNIIYNSLNAPTSVMDPLGYQTQYFYEDPNFPTLPTKVEYPLSFDGGATFISTQYEYYQPGNVEGQPAGKVKLVTDTGGNQTFYIYTSSGQVASVTTAYGTPDSQTTNYSYDNVGNLTDQTDNAGIKTHYEYDAARRLIKIVRNYDPARQQNEQNKFNLTTEYRYDARGNQIAVIDTNGNITRTYYDLANRPVTFVQNLIGQAIEDSTPPVRDSSVTDQNIRTDTVYDANGRATATIDPKGIVTRIYYDAAGRPVTVVDNLVGQDVSVTTPPARGSHDQNVRTDTVYDANGNAIATIDPRGIITRTYYDQDNRPLTVVQNLTGQSISNPTPPARASDGSVARMDTVYDANGNAIAAVDPKGTITRTYYDAMNRTITVVQNLTGQSISYSDPPVRIDGATDQNIRMDTYYDQAGNAIATVDPRGSVTRTYYDQANRPVTVVQNLVGQDIYTNTPPAAGSSTENIRTDISYDSNGRRDTATDPLGRATKYVYSELGQVVQVTANYLPSQGQNYQDKFNLMAQYSYDSLGRQVSMTDTLDRVTVTAYDMLGRALSTTQNYAPGQPQNDQNQYNILTQYEYDVNGNQVSMTDPNGRTVFMSYDALGRMVSITNADGETDTEYDSNGNVLSVTDPARKTTHFTYDLLNRKASATDADSNTTYYGYDGLGNQISLIDGRGIYTRYEYDALGRLTAVIENYRTGFPADAQTNVRTEYTYDASSNRLTIKDGNGHTTNFEYDELNRLKRETDPLGHTWQYSYDAAGNRVTMGDANGQITQYHYDEAGRLDSIAYPDANVAFGYDALGRRTSMTDALGSTSWQYDALNRAASITDPFEKTVQYTYDPAGNRTQLTYPDGKSLNYQYDPMNRIQRVTGDLLTGEVRYQYTAAGQLQTITRPNGVNTTYSYTDAGRLHDLIHSSSSGTLASYTYEYDGDGNRVSVVENLVQPILPTPTPTNTLTATASPTDTPTDTPTSTPTETFTPTPTNTSTFTPTSTPTATATFTPTATNTPTPTNTLPTTPTFTPTNTSTATATPRAPLVVTRFDDTNDGICDQDCSLRDAVMAANASPGPDVIQLSAGTYTLSIPGTGGTNQGGLEVYDDLIIQGAGPGATTVTAVDGWTSRLFDTDHISITFADLTLRGNNTTSNSGGAVFFWYGSAALQRVVVRDSRTTNVAGGGIFSLNTTLTITNSAIVNNVSGQDGGGLYNSGGTAVLTNVTISGNSATNDGGGVFNTGSGTLTMTNVTISNNTADSDADNAGNGGGFNRTSGTTTNLKNTILSGNHDNSPSTIIPDCSGKFNSQGHNLLGINDNNSCQFTPTTGDQAGTTANPVDASLGTLTDNGGGTLTHALLPGSIAINSGDNTGSPVTDQRGYNRDSTCDIGAYEYTVAIPTPTFTPTPSLTPTNTSTPTPVAPMTYTVTTFNDSNDGSCGSTCSLRDAIAASNNHPGPDIIVLSSGTYTLSISGSGGASVGDLDIYGPVTIQGAGATSTVITADPGFGNRIFSISVSTSDAVTISGLTLQNGSAPSGSGAGGLYSDSANLTLDHVIVQNNSSSTSSGGGLVVNGGSLTLTDSAILNNSAGSGNSGGGLYYTGGANVTMINVTISGNIADHIGGGFYANGGGTATLTNVTLSNNTVTNTTNGEGAAFGVWASGMVSLKNVVSAGNIDNGPWNGVDCADLGVNGTVVSQGHNLIGISTGCTLTAQEGDQLGSRSSPIDAKLDVLADNGGSTLTHALLADSPAINAGDNNGCPATDQRGFARDSSCDIGAYEYGSTAFWGRGFANINFGLGSILPQAVDTETPTPTVSDTPVPTPTFTDTSTPTPTNSPAPSATPTTQPSQSVTINYIYDPLNRLTEANYSTGDYYHYGYDAVGNRLTQEKSVNGQLSTDSYTYDNANRLTSVNGVTYTWDNNGNLLSDGVNIYTYDSANRLVSVNGTTSYGYNGLGDRLTQDNVHYTLDLNANLTQVLDDGTNTYLYGVDRIVQSNSANTDYFLGDALGSVRQLADVGGIITLTEAYDPYGVATAAVGTSQTAYGYTGEQTDAIGLVYLRARYYSSTDGRFLTKDLWLGENKRPRSFNKWNYAEENPINYADPSGQDPYGCEYVTDVIGCYNRLLNRTSSSYNLPVPPSPTPTLQSVIFYDTKKAIPYALNEWPFDLTPDESSCAYFVSQVLEAGGVSDPSGLWSANNKSTIPLFKFLSTYFAVVEFSSPDNNGIILRNNVSWEKWITLEINRIREGDIVFYKISDNGTVHDYWDHAGVIVNPSDTETTLYRESTGNNKPRFVEQDGLLNKFCGPPGSDQTHIECGFGDPATGAGRSIDDTSSMVAKVAIVLMQEPRH